MPRLKLPTKANPNLAMESFARRNLNPFEAAIQELNRRIPLRDDDDPEVIKPMLKRWDLHVDEQGKRWLVTPQALKVDILKEFMAYASPKLRTSEGQEERDYSIQVIVQNFPDAQKPVTIKLEEARPKEIEG